MIPYFEFTSIHLGPITFQVWGTFVALGILLGSFISARFAKRRGLDHQHIYNGAFWIILGAFLMARVFHIVAYDPSFYSHNPSELIKVWHGGFSVIGGFIGAIIAYILYIKRNHLAWLSYVDSFIYGLPLGLACGRIGCFLIHDHPGTATNFFLGVKNENGPNAFHDHGLYLSLNAFLLAIVFWFLAKNPRSEGFFVRVFLIWYGAVRFALDFWRIGDQTYLGVTPAQYAAFLMFLVGVIWSLSLMNKSDKSILK